MAAPPSVPSAGPSTNRPEPLLQLENVAVHFGGVVAVSDVSVAFDAGRTCGLIGPNGAGKTTLFDVVAGLTPPTHGRIILEGADITRRSPTWRSRHGLRRTFQRQQTFGSLSVEDNVLAATEWHGGGGGVLADFAHLPHRRALERTRRERVSEVLELCGIGHLAGTRCGQLPIGQARLVEIARAVVDKPRVLLLDEPTSGLGEPEIEEFASVLRQVQHETQCSIILVEHDVPFVMAQCDRILVLNLGQIIADGTPEGVQADPAVAVAYLG